MKLGPMKLYISRPDRIEKVITTDSSVGWSSTTGSSAKAIATGTRKMIARNGVW